MIDCRISGRDEVTINDEDESSVEDTNSRTLGRQDTLAQDIEVEGDGDADIVEYSSCEGVEYHQKYGRSTRTPIQSARNNRHPHRKPPFQHYFPSSSASSSCGSNSNMNCVSASDEGRLPPVVCCSDSQVPYHEEESSGRVCGGGETVLTVREDSMCTRGHSSIQDITGPSITINDDQQRSSTIATTFEDEPSSVDLSITGSSSHNSNTSINFCTKSDSSSSGGSITSSGRASARLRTSSSRHNSGRQKLSINVTSAIEAGRNTSTVISTPTPVITAG